MLSALRSDGAAVRSAARDAIEHELHAIEHELHATDMVRHAIFTTVRPTTLPLRKVSNTDGSSWKSMVMTCS